MPEGRRYNGRMRSAPALCVLSLCLLAALPATAQENVRYDYAQVLNVEPIYQTLNATRMERQCEGVAAPRLAQAPEEPRSGLQRVVGAVRGMLGNEPAPPAAPAPLEQSCRMVAVPREFRRPVAYDVDYVYKGSKYRTRTTRDPGNRLRVRVSVTPDIAE